VGLALRCEAGAVLHLQHYDQSLGVASTG
jgi:hypothetical protein